MTSRDTVKQRIRNWAIAIAATFSVAALLYYFGFYAAKQLPYSRMLHLEEVAVGHSIGYEPKILLLTGPAVATLDHLTPGRYKVRATFQSKYHAGLPNNFRATLMLVRVINTNGETGFFFSTTRASRLFSVKPYNQENETPFAIACTFRDIERDARLGLCIEMNVDASSRFEPFYTSKEFRSGSSLQDAHMETVRVARGPFVIFAP